MFLEQHVSKPTRLNNILDLVFASHDIINEIDVQKTFISDHNIIHVQTNMLINQCPTTQSLNPVKNVFESLNFHKANWVDITAELENIDWQVVSLNHLNSDQCLSKLMSIVKDICVKCVPTKSNNKSNKKSRFYKDRRRLWRKHKRTILKLKTRISKHKRDKLVEVLQIIEKGLLDSHENERKFNESSAIAKIKTDPRYFFKYASRHSKLSKAIGPLLDEHKELTDNCQSMYQLLQDQYLRVFSTPTERYSIDNIKSFFNSGNIAEHLLRDINITDEDVFLSIK